MKALYIFLCLWLMACNSAPVVYVSADKNFHEQHGILYLDGKPFSGNQFMLYENGDTSFVYRYADGRKTGEHRAWWQNRKLKFIYHYDKDVFEGPVQEWYADGRLYRSMNYAEGHEKGLQQIRLPDGSLYANYEVRNGRNYGMTGTRHCKNYWKDER